MKTFSRKGFTLIEVLAVVAILGVLMTAGVITVSSTIKNGRISSTTNSLQTFAADTEEILAEYGVLRIENGDTKAQVLEYLNLIENFYVHTYFDRSSLIVYDNYFEIQTATLIDGWDSPFKLKYYFKDNNAGTCMLISPGPDLVFMPEYKVDDFGDDILLIVYPKTL